MLRRAASWPRPRASAARFSRRMSGRRRRLHQRCATATTRHRGGWRPGWPAGGGSARCFMSVCAAPEMAVGRCRLVPHVPRSAGVAPGASAAPAPLLAVRGLRDAPVGRLPLPGEPDRVVVHREESRPRPAARVDGRPGGATRLLARRRDRQERREPRPQRAVRAPDRRAVACHGGGRRADILRRHPHRMAQPTTSWVGC